MVKNQIDVNVVVDGTQEASYLRSLNIANIVSVFTDADDNTVIKYCPNNNTKTNQTIVLYQVTETQGAIFAKASAAAGSEAENPLFTATVTAFNYNELTTPQDQILNSGMIQSMRPLYDDDDVVVGTTLKYGSWFKSIISIEEILVTDTPSSST